MGYTIFDYISGADLKGKTWRSSELREQLTFNIGAQIALGVSLIAGVLFMLSGSNLEEPNLSTTYGVYHLTFAAVYSVVIVLLRRTNHNLLKLAFLFLIDWQLIVFAGSFGETDFRLDVYIKAMFIISVGWIYLIFESQPRIYRIAAFVLSLACLIFIEFPEQSLFEQLRFGADDARIIRFLLATGCIAMAWYLIRTMHATRGYYMDRFRSSREALISEKQTSANLRSELSDQIGEYKLLSDNTSDLIALHDTGLNIQFISPSATVLLGYAGPFFLDKNLLDFIHPDDRQKFSVQNFLKPLMKGNMVKTACRYRNQTGQYIWYQTLSKPIFNEEGELERVLSTSRIIEEERRLEQLLVESQRMAHMGGWELNISTRQFYWTEEVRNIHEVDENHTPTLDNEIYFFDAETRNIYHRAINEAITDNKAFDLELPFISGKGKNKWVRVVGRPHAIRNKPYKISGLIHDITRQKQIELQIIRAKEVAEQATIAKSEFISVMSHEIRTPMNAVIGLSHVLLEDDPRDNQKDNLTALNFSAKHLLAIINDVLDFSKIESGKLQFEANPFNLHESLERIRATLLVKAKEKELELLTDIHSNVPELLVGDEVRLNQVLLNLVGNAIKFTETGSVTIRVQKRLKQSTSAYAALQFDVIDTGIGIDSDKLQTIFESFTQESSETTRKFGGTGLGLAISKRIVELQEGRIWAESKKGMGSRFSFTLRFALDKSAVPELPQPSEAHTETGNESSDKLTDMRVLLVEDNTVNQFVAGRFFTNWNIEADIANHGGEAIEKVKSETYDLILMDLQMPEIDGYQAARTIRDMSENANSKIPILALTASGYEEVKDKITAAGMTDFISKPFVPEDFQQKLMQYAPQAKES